MRGIESKIGFDKVKAQILAKLSTNMAAEILQNEEPLFTREEILEKLTLTDEMRLICMFEDSFPSQGFVDTRSFLLPLSVPSTYIDLPSLKILSQSLDTLKKIINFFRNSEEQLYPTLRKLSQNIAYFPEISRRIDQILDRFGEVRDTASPELQQIRRSLREKDGVIAKRIASILKSAQSEGIVDEDATVSMRDGRVLIPVAVANKKKLSGLVYDESASGKTAFVEPMEVVELNNQVRELKFREQREILRILLEFTDFLRPYLPELISAADYIGMIDFIRAKALVALDMRAGLPVISQENTMHLRKARHPLLERTLNRENKEIVPLTLSLDSKKHILLISGPNAGGKSVCLKTVGLLQYMFQWGMLIPTSEISEMMIFDNIFIDIGDNQSIENDLSTYSSHLATMKNMLDSATENSLVLIDEFGSGTEPTAGGAIAEAILKELEERGVYGVITTHYTNLKLCANSSSGIVNGAMQFDVKNIKPLFVLEVGLPGNSFAFEIARKMGVPERIVQNAEELAGSDFVDIEKQLRKIAKNRRQLDEKLAKIRTTDKTLESITDKYQKELSEIKALKKSVLDQAKAEAKEILAQANQKIENTIREIRETQAEKEKTKLLRKDLQEFKDSILSDNSDEGDRRIEAKIEQISARKEREQQRKARRSGVKPAVVKKEEQLPQRALQVGDKVKVKGSDLVGEVTQINAKRVSVSVGNIISTMAISKVEQISNNQYKELSKPIQTRSNYDAYAMSDRKLNFKPSIDIRGERLGDALEIVTRFIDDAMMVRVSEVKILHGKGNGILREEIRKYIKTMPGVSSFRDEAIELGGAGITVVNLDV